MVPVGSHIIFTRDRSESNGVLENALIILDPHTPHSSLFTNACHILSYGFASQIHVTKISFTCRRVSSASLCVTSPRIRIASPGLGNGCRFRNDCGIPRKPPSLRTSSLNNHLSGSTVFNRMIPGTSPTLWWLLFFWELPHDGEISFPVDSSERGGRDSIMLGYIVPCNKNSSVILSFFPNKLPNSSKTAIHLVPIIFRFVSGSSTPFNL